MGEFQRGGNRGGGFRGGNGGGRPSFGGNRGGDRGPVTMHKAVCDECQKSCEVPFRPSGDKPIFCNECFSSKKGADDRGPRKDFGGDRAPRREFNDRPSFSKPVSAPVGDDTKKLLSEMNSKLDRLVSAIEKITQPKSVIAPVTSKVEVKKAPVVKATTKKVVSKAPVKKVVAKKKK
jgi:CxxC-x17-CxxC domain-containing protein